MSQRSKEQQMVQRSRSQIKADQNQIEELYLAVQQLVQGAKRKSTILKLKKDALDQQLPFKDFQKQITKEAPKEVGLAMQQKYQKKQTEQKKKPETPQQETVLGKRPKRKIQPRKRLGEESSDDDQKLQARGRGKGRQRTKSLTPQKRRKVEPESQSQNSSNVEQFETQEQQEGSQQIEEEGEQEMEEEQERGESEMEEQEEQVDEELSNQNQSEANEDQQSEQSQDNELDQQNHKIWKSQLIKDGLGTFLNPKMLMERVHSALVKHNLSDSAAPKLYGEALGYLMDSTEYYMKDMVCKTIKRARVRMQGASICSGPSVQLNSKVQEQHLSMSNARAGDIFQFNSISYQLQQYRQVGIINRPPLSLMCTGNVQKESEYLTAKEFEQAKIQQQNIEAKPETETNEQVQDDVEPKKQRKKAIDPEQQRLKEIRHKEQIRQLENENFQQAQSTFALLAGDGKNDVQAPTETRTAKTLPPVESIINLSGTSADSKPKTIVVMSSSKIEQRDQDFYCSYQKKVILKDLIQVLQTERQFKHSSLLYNLLI